MYNLIVELELIPGNGSIGGDKFMFNKTIGFRTVELIEDPIENNKGKYDVTVIIKQRMNTSEKCIKRKIWLYLNYIQSEGSGGTE